jgi:hypothetical protein
MYMYHLAADAHAHIQRLVSVVKTATVLEECPTEDQRSLVRYLLPKGLNPKDVHKTNISCLRWELFAA